MMAAVQLAVHSPCFPRMKCCCQVGRTTDTSNNSWRAIDRESSPRMAPCYLWVAATTFCLLNPRAQRSFSVFAVPGFGCSGISTRVSGMTLLFTGPCETNWTGLLPDSPENQHQAIVYRSDDSRASSTSFYRNLFSAAFDAHSRPLVCIHADDNICAVGKMSALTSGREVASPG